MTVVRAEVDRRMEPLGLTQAQWIPVLRLGSGEAQTAADLARSTLQTLTLPVLPLPKM